jgi:hypothetical protein
VPLHLPVYAKIEASAFAQLNTAAATFLIPASLATHGQMLTESVVDGNTGSDTETPYSEVPDCAEDELPNAFVPPIPAIAMYGRSVTTGGAIALAY